MCIKNGPFAELSRPPYVSSLKATFQQQYASLLYFRSLVERENDRDSCKKVSERAKSKNVGNKWRWYFAFKLKKWLAYILLGSQPPITCSQNLVSVYFHSNLCQIKNQGYIFCTTSKISSEYYELIFRSVLNYDNSTICDQSIQCQHRCRHLTLHQCHNVDTRHQF